VRVRANSALLVAPTLAVRISKELGRDVIHPLGRLDAGNRNLLFCHCLAAGKHHVVIDMTYVSEIDHDALAGILAARSVLESECGSLSIRHASGQPAQLLTSNADTGHNPERTWSTTWL
jgi:anti-anti-sigma regulatory factor